MLYLVTMIQTDVGNPRSVAPAMLQLLAIALQYMTVSIS